MLKVQLDLKEKGYTLLLPTADYTPFDLVAHKDDSFIKVQVKYRSINNQNKIRIDTSSTWLTATGRKYSDNHRQHIDLYAIYCPDRDTVYYLPSLKVTRTLYIYFDESSKSKYRAENCNCEDSIKSLAS